MTEDYVEVRGLRLRYREVGDGDPVLLINGLGGCLESWQPLVDRLPHLRFITVDHPGVGLSTVPRAPLPMDACADLYADLLDALGYASVDLLGFSFGGAVAQEFAHRHPHRVRRLVLAATAFGLGSQPADPMTLFLASNPLRYLSRAARRRSAPLIYRGRVGREPHILDTELRGINSHAASVMAVRFQVWAYAHWSSAPWLHTLRMPTLVLAGAEDPMAPAVNAVTMARMIRGASLHILPGGGHLFPFDSADQTAPILKAFMNAESLVA